jgi:hypothetical protein
MEGPWKGHGGPVAVDDAARTDTLDEAQNRPTY